MRRGRGYDPHTPLKPKTQWRCHLASKKIPTVPTRTQDTITQRELTLLGFSQVRLAELIVACQHYEGDIVKRLKAGAVVEPGRLFMEGTSVEVRS